MRLFDYVGLLVCAMVAISCTETIGQELVGYELVDNNSVGLSVAPFEKWGMAIADIDNNGWPDIFTERWASPGYSRLYVNNEGVFQDITDQTPLQSIEENETHTRTVALVDYDNDGDKDIFFGTDERLYFLQNDNNVFTEVSESIGLVGHKSPGFVSRWDFNTGAWADYDLDGDLDVAICQTNNPDFYLFRNDDGTFTDIATDVGLGGVVPLGTWADGGNITDRMRWVDFDLDGDPDLSAGQFLFQNDDGQFSEVSESLGFTPSLPIQNSDWFDYDNDGDLDFFKTVTYMNDEGENEFWENQDGNFINVTDQLLAVGMRERYRGLSMGDFDNDGDEDIFISININETMDVLLLNEEVEPGVRAFDDVAEYVGVTQMGDRKGGAFFDYDKDGFLDLYLPSAEHNHILYHNLKNSNNWVGFILEGTESNRDAIGTLVKCVAGGVSQIRYTKAPNGFTRQDNPWVHFGLGQATSIDSVIVRWPLGRVEVFTDVAINQYHQLKEGEATGVIASQGDQIPTEYKLEQNFPNPFSARGGSASGRNPQTTIMYTMPKAGEVRIVISNLLGEQVRSFVRSFNSAGSYRIVWDGRNENNEVVPSGMYFYRMETADFVATRKMLFLR